MKTLKPKALKRGDVIGVIAPASPLPSMDRVEKGAEYLERLGYRVTFGKNFRAVRGFLAGSDKQRAADINTMFGDKKIKAILAARGGYGSPRVLPLLDYSLIRRNPKILIGYSDLTALQLALFKKAGLISFSGPMLGIEMFKGIDPFTEEQFWRMVTSTKKFGLLQNPGGRDLKPFHGGKGSGSLLGGNLSIITSIAGTPYLPSFKNSIFYFEEVDEDSYRFDRMMNQAKLCGIFKEANGILIGELTNVKPYDPSTPHLTIDQILADHLSGLRKPILRGLVYGHIPRKLTLPIGIRASIDGTHGLVELLESTVQE
ncbi:MAG TPA: LD-carboxypeptidase [Bacteroidota bacterium]|nr:LD-carboxypeptidase [Bacteroidota bacterium]